MLRLGAGRDHLNIVADQYGCPTYARDLAEAILATITNRDVDNYSGLKKGGIYNFSNAGLTNWADFARTIFDYSKIKCTVGETTTKAYNAPAPRPLWSMMSKERIQKDFHIELHDWKKSLKLCLKELKRR